MLARSSTIRPASTSAANPGISRFPCFDGLRAIAALSVVGVHSAFMSGFTGRSVLGNYTARLEIGVSVFFVISGFLLYHPFAAAHFGLAPAPSKKAFWLRRAKRIIPAYWAAFLVITYVLHADTVRHGWGSLAIYLGFAQIYAPSHVLSGITQAWSLCVEMTFYLALPMWAALMAPQRARRGRGDRDAQLRFELWGLAALAGASFAYRLPLLLAHGYMVQVMPNWLPAFLDLFSLGMLMAVLSAWRASGGDAHRSWTRSLERPAFPWVCWCLASFVFVLVSNIGLPTSLASTSVARALGRQEMYGLFSLLLVAPAVFGPQRGREAGAIRSLLAAKPLALIGVVSYGVYLWHQAFIALFLRWTGDTTFHIPLPNLVLPVSALAIAAATASYALVERPVRRFRLTGRPRPIATVVTP